MSQAVVFLALGLAAILIAALLFRQWRGNVGNVGTVVAVVLGLLGLTLLYTAYATPVDERLRTSTAVSTGPTPLPVAATPPS